MADLNGDKSKMAKAIKRQPDWVLPKLGLERDAIQIPKSNRAEEEKGKGEASRLTTPRYSPPHMRNLEPFKVYNNPLSDVLDNNYEKGDRWKNTPYHENKNQYNYRQCNNHNGERRTNNGEITGNWNNRDKTNNVSNNGGNHGNNGNYGNNEDAREWYRNLLDRCIGSWQEFVTIFLEEFGEHNDTSFASHELTNIKKNQNESIYEFNKRFNKEHGIRGGYADHSRSKPETGRKKTKTARDGRRRRAKSESNENEAVSRFRRLEREEEPEA
ncbi:uncharacterized protein LOC131050793 [Cryptomeria japonica]|uniref:uncharacterized protein LOC131050793 n=1 Tax=Cryptomeria japonica TaxID=3369 RepID=UPI0027D9CF52|nr:uncharacterized protein LOC131050793 [Cryptomeria japonica]